MKILHCGLFTNEERQFNYELKDQRGNALALAEIDRTGQLLDKRGYPVQLSGDYELVASNSQKVIKRLKVTLKEGKLEKIKR